MWLLLYILHRPLEIKIQDGADKQRKEVWLNFGASAKRRKVCQARQDGDCSSYLLHPENCRLRNKNGMFGWSRVVLCCM